MAACYDGQSMSEKWVTSYQHLLDDGTTLEVGDTFALRGEKGKRYRYIRTVHNPDLDDTWVDCFGGGHGREKSRSVHPERITRVKKKRRET